MILVASLIVEVQATKTASLAFFQLSQVILATVIHAIVTFSLDYCNSVSVVLPLRMIQKLQHPLWVVGAPMAASGVSDQVQGTGALRV